MASVSSHANESRVYDRFLSTKEGRRRLDYVATLVIGELTIGDFRAVQKVYSL